MSLSKKPSRLSYLEASRLTGLPCSTLYSLVSRHAIPHFRIGPRLVRFDRAELEQWLSARHVPAHADESRE